MRIRILLHITTLIVVATVGTGCGDSSTKPTRTAAASHMDSELPVVRAELHRTWNAPSATVVTAARGPQSISGRMRVASRLMKIGAPKPVDDHRTARQVLGAPTRVTAAGSTWIYVLSRRTSAGDVCTRTLEVRFRPDGRVRTFVQDIDEECASDHQPATPRSK